MWLKLLFLKITFFISLVFSSPIFAKGLPFFVIDDKSQQLKTVTIKRKRLKRLIKRVVLQSKKNKIEQSQDLELNWLVLGLGADVRKGFMKWQASTSLAMEFHLRVLK